MMHLDRGALFDKTPLFASGPVGPKSPEKGARQLNRLPRAALKLLAMLFKR